MKKRFLRVLIPALFGVLILSDLSIADAQRRYGYGYGGPQRRPGMAFKHRFHPYIGGQLMGMGILAQSTGFDEGYLGAGGGGGGFFAGLRMGPYFSLEFNYGITYHNAVEDVYWDDYWGYDSVWSAIHLQTFTVDAKIHIPTYGPVEPYVQAGIGGAVTGVSWDDGWDYGDYVLASGVAFDIGGGLDYWVSPFLSVGGRLLYKGIRFGELEVDAAGRSNYTNFANAVSGEVNATLHF